MADFRYTKKIILVDLSLEGRKTHEADERYQDWYYDQVEQGLADSARTFIPVRYTGENDCTTEHLVTDQAQADSYIAISHAVAERIGYPFSFTIVDVDYTTDTIPDDFSTF